MANPIQIMAREVLREEGPLTVDQVLARLAGRHPLSVSPNPKQRVRNALTSDPAVQSTGDGRYLYLPTFIRGASVRMPMDLAAPDGGMLAVGVEAFALLWPEGVQGERGPEATLQLEGGPTATVKWQHGGWMGGGLRQVMKLPAAFWRWWEEQQRAGAGAVLLSCRDGEAGRFVLRAVRTADLDAEAVAARNGQVTEAAVAALKRTSGVSPANLAYRLLARGIYHGEPAPDPPSVVLLEPEGQFSIENTQVTYRPEMTPTLKRLFASRMVDDLLTEDSMLRQALGLPATGTRQTPELTPMDRLLNSLLGLPSPPEPVSEARPEIASEATPQRPAERGYRIKVTLQWKPGVWRVVEMLDNQTLEDLHYAIQGAFGWDDDHLYAFFLSGRAWDTLTEVDRPEFHEDAEPPLANQVTLADMEPKPGQRFLYIFDFGDELCHDIEVVESFPVPKRGKFPRIVERHGKAPRQYPSWD